MMKTLISVFFPILLAGVLWAGPEQTYNQLALKDLDQMTELVAKKVAASEQSGTEPLKEGLIAVLSRPDEDFMVEKVIGPLRQELDEKDLWESTLEEVANEAIAALKKPKGIPAPTQVTYSILLTNLISQLKPGADAPGFSRRIIEKIRDARIKLTDEMMADRRLRMMRESISPSVVAEEALPKLKKKK